jgi:hypothetical protein
MSRCKDNCLLVARLQEVLNHLDLLPIDHNLVVHLLPELVTQVKVEICGCGVEASFQLGRDLPGLRYGDVEDLLLGVVLVFSLHLEVVQPLHDGLLDLFFGHDHVD